MRTRILIGALCGLVLPLAFGLPALQVSVSAWQQATCDFLTGGGFIYPTGTPMAGKGTFAVAGGCKHDAFWGHLEYQDHLLGVKVHDTEITGYMVDNTIFPDPFARLICGKGRTPLGDVDFLVRAKEGGCDGDEFDIQLSGAVVYTTFLNGPHQLGGGSIVLHKPNHSNSGVFGGTCPLLPGGGGGGEADVSVVKTSAGDIGAGQTAIYHITVMAGGGSDSTNVLLTDPLPLRLVGTPWAISGDTAGCSITLNMLTCDFGTMTAGTSRTITLTTMTDGSEGGSTLSNTATVASGNDTNLNNNVSGPVNISINPPE